MSLKRRLCENGAYSVMQLCTWSFYSILLSFSGNILRYFGFSDSRISLFLGSAAVLALCIQVLIGNLSDRNPDLQVSNILMAIGGVMVLGCLMVRSGIGPVWAAIAAYGICCVGVHLIPPFSNGVGMDAIRRGSCTNYSLARGIGSLGYSIFALITGSAVEKHGVMAVPVVGCVSALILIGGTIWFKLCCLRHLPPHSTESVQSRKKVKRESGFLRRYPTFLIFLIATFFLQLSHALVNNFMFQIVQSKGGTAATQGVAAAICAFSELPVIFLFPLMLRKVRCGGWLQVAALGMLLKPLGTFFAVSPQTLYIAQAFQMLGYGIFAISSVNYAEAIVGKGESIQAQSFLGAAITCGTLGALFTGGVLCQYLGVDAMLLIAVALAFTGGLCVFFAVGRQKK